MCKYEFFCSIDISLPSTLRPSPLLLTLHPFTGKLVTASADRIGGRCVHKGCVLLKTILQTPAKKSEDEVVIEIPMEQVGEGCELSFAMGWGWGEELG